MPSIYEQAGSPEITSSLLEPSALRRYRILDTADELTALALAAAYAPTVYLNLFRQQIKLSPVAEADGTKGMWDVEIPYVPKPLYPLQVGEFRYSGKTTGGTRHVTQALSTQKVYSSTGPLLPGVVSFGGLIGVSSDGVEGTEIVSPVFEWTEERTFHTNSVTQSYLRNLFYLTGSVNADSFRGFPAGEVLFMGADFSIRTAEHWKFIFSFKAAPNVANKTFGNFTAVDKDGWQYAWTWDTPTVNTNQNCVLRQPRYLIIENVYDYKNFSGLGIGVLPLFP